MSFRGSSYQVSQKSGLRDSRIVFSTTSDNCPLYGITEVIYQTLYKVPDIGIPGFWGNAETVRVLYLHA